MKILLTVLLLMLAAAPAAAQSRADSAQSYVARGAAWFEKGEVERAISDYNLAIAFDPRSATAWLNRAIARSYKGDHEGALEDYARTLDLDPLQFAALNPGNRAHCFHARASQ